MDIRKLREKKGLTRVQLANKLKVSITAVQNWENGTSKPSEANQTKLDAILL